MTGDVGNAMRDGEELAAVEVDTSADTGGKVKEKGRRSEDRKKHSSRVSSKDSAKRHGKEKKDAEKTKETQRKREESKDGDKSKSKEGNRSSDSKRKERSGKHDTKDEKRKSSHRDRRDRDEERKHRERDRDRRKERKDKKGRDESRVEKRQEKGRHSDHQSHRSRSRRRHREGSHTREERSSERHKFSHKSHSRRHGESRTKHDSKHTSTKRKRSTTPDATEKGDNTRETKRCNTTAVEAASAAAALPASSPPQRAVAEVSPARASVPMQQQHRAPPPPPPTTPAPQVTMKNSNGPHRQQERGRAATLASRDSTSPPRGGMRYKSRSNSRGRERRSPSYGAYRGRDASAEREEPKETPGEGAEEEDEDEAFDLSFTGGRFGELLDQEVSCSVVGGEVAIPEPADTLDGCKAGDQPLLDPLVVENLKKMKCRWLLPIQRYAIPIVGRGHDLLGCAATGCGKTLAFLAPLVSKVISCAGLFRPHFPGSHAQASPLSVVLCPTRELAIQIDEQLARLLGGSSLSHSLWIGGISATEQVHEINQRQIDVAICTPGRVDELCLRGKVTLEFVQLLVLDEADAMLDLGFQKVMTELATSRDMPENRQTLLFSATFPPNLQSMLPSILRSPYFRVEVGKALTRMRDETAIRQEVKWVPGWDERLAELLKDIQAFVESQRAGGDGELPGEGGQVIVFVGGKRTVKGVADHLRAANIGTETLFGTMPQEQRKQVYLTFRSRKVRALVATSIAARGLDFPDVGLVINFEMPPTIEPYVHRIGRTGRAGRSGRAISYFTQKDGHLAPSLIAHLTKCKAPVPPWLGRLAR